jgi:hypothetical protein
MLQMNGTEEDGWFRKCLGLKKQKHVEAHVILLFKCLACGSKTPCNRSYVDLLNKALNVMSRTIERHVTTAELPFRKCFVSTSPTAENNASTEMSPACPNLVLDEEEKSSDSAICVASKIISVTSEEGRKVKRNYFLVPERRKAFSKFVRVAETKQGHMRGRTCG